MNYSIIDINQVMANSNKSCDILTYQNCFRNFPKSAFVLQKVLTVSW